MVGVCASRMVGEGGLPKRGDSQAEMFAKQISRTEVFQAEEPKWEVFSSHRGQRRWGSLPERKPKRGKLGLIGRV